MNKGVVMMNVKMLFCSISGAAGAVIAGIFGGWSGALTTLVIFMGLDFFTGLVVAGVFKASKKTGTGALESGECFKGILRKALILMIVIVSYRLDLLMGTDYIKNAVIIAFCANELISLIENAGLMGVPIPAPIRNAVELLKKDGEDSDSN